MERTYPMRPGVSLLPLHGRNVNLLVIEEEQFQAYKIHLVKNNEAHLPTVFHRNWHQLV